MSDEIDQAQLPLRDAIDLTEFLKSRKSFSNEECQDVVGQAILVLESLYVHLPVKRAMYAVDPLRRLRLLQHRLTQPASPIEDGTAPENATDDLWFHREMSDIFTSLRDLHTVYLLPEPFDRAVALLPFQVEDYFAARSNGDRASDAADQRRYMLSTVLADLPWFDPPPGFEPGAEVTHWNGIAIGRAVELAGTRNAGSNPEARRARGLSRLTIRPLVKSVPPDEEWVILGYRDRRSGEAREMRVRWHVAMVPEDHDIPPDGAQIREAMGLALDIETDVIRGVKKRLYVPGLFQREREIASLKTELVRRRQTKKTMQMDEAVETTLPGLLRASRHTVGGREYGYIRLRSFKVPSIDSFIEEFMKLLDEMPQDGLIIDVRDNGGGYIEAGERLLQLLTPKTIHPERLQFINTPLNLRICSEHSDLTPWVDSMLRAVESGNTFSAAYAHTSLEACNNIGQRYYGPVVLVINALCYSTTDIFAAGFQDHEIGQVIGTDAKTGAGGANVVSHKTLCNMLEEDSPFTPLPGGADLRVALRRTLRVGERAGTELEDVGVTPTVFHRTTVGDVLQGNIDLIAAAAKILRDQPSYDLRETRAPARRDGRLSTEVTTRNIDRLDMLLRPDLFVDGWACPSRAVRDGAHNIDVELPAKLKAKWLELRGYRENRLVAARKIPLR
jgi:C-terminal processing protease CtpA/Prc